jgi:hypothetical protein
MELEKRLAKVKNELKSMEEARKKEATTSKEEEQRGRRRPPKTWWLDGWRMMVDSVEVFQRCKLCWTHPGFEDGVVGFWVIWDEWNAGYGRWDASLENGWMQGHTRI